MAYIGNRPTEQLYTAYADRYNGNASNTTFDLSRNVGSVNDIEVVVGGVQKNPFTEYSISANGYQVIFNSAPAAGTDNIVISYRNYVVATIIPEDGSIINSMIQGNTITGDKLVANTITSREIADGAVLANNLGTGVVTSTQLSATGVTAGVYGGFETTSTANLASITVDSAGRITSASNVSVDLGLNPFLLAGI